MQLSSYDLQHLCQLAISAAYKAGKIIAEHAHHSITINSKTGGSSLASQVVTEVDLLSQAAILNILTPSSDTYNLALLTEETPDNLERLNHDYFWCIDPLDGTLPFIEATSGYAVSISLVSQNGTPHIGVIYDPITDTVYHAIKDSGAFINNKPWLLKPELQSAMQPLTFICDRSFRQHMCFPKVIDSLNHFSEQQGYYGIKTICHGGAVMNACWVLENHPACYFKFPKPQNGGGSLWDYAASTCLFLELGVFASDIFGKPLALNRIDSSFMNHNGVLFSSDSALTKHIIKLFSQLQSGA